MRECPDKMFSGLFESAESSQSVSTMQYTKKRAEHKAQGKKAQNKAQKSLVRSNVVRFFTSSQQRVRIGTSFARSLKTQSPSSACSLSQDGQLGKKSIRVFSNCSCIIRGSNDVYSIIYRLLLKGSHIYH